MLNKSDNPTHDTAPDFIVVPNGAIYSSGKQADLYYRGGAGVHQVAVLEADDRDPPKCQFRLLTVVNGQNSYGVGKGGYSREAAEETLRATSSVYWNDAQELRGMTQTKEGGR